MKIQVEVISTEMIKPSSPTPHHLSNYQRSFLDQIASPIFMPMVYFYPAGEANTNDRSNHLKKTLSEVLTLYYPLAGRVKDDKLIDCNDEGVPYTEARVNSNLLDFITNPQPGDLKPLLPYELDDPKDICAAVQVNFFKCGGLGLTLLLSHKAGDGFSFYLFSTTWAALARLDEGNIVSPRLDSSLLFPPVEDLLGFDPTVGMLKESFEARRFVFSASSISSLREKYTDYSIIEQPIRPTRLEAISALILTRFIAATQTHIDISQQVYMVSQSVNLRTRMDPPLDNYFGNVSRPTSTILNTKTNEEVCYGLVKRGRDSMKSINKEFIAKIQGGEEYLRLLKQSTAEMGADVEVICFSFTSLVRFPMYEMDFGWGKPIWVGSATLKYKNLVTFMDTKSGGGIEAWINLSEEDMKKFEVDDEFLSHVSSSQLDY